MPPRYLFTAGLVGARVFAAEPEAISPPASSIEFNRDVRPILSNFCFKCHGFDEKAREAGRRLDTREGALEDQDGVKAIVPGDPRSSEIHRRIHAADTDEIMPPPKSGKKLSPDQKAVIDRWIEQGARYQNHWAFEPVKQPALPENSGRQTPDAATWNPIDEFILARLAREGLTLSHDADPVTLCRRLFLDLVGFPPMPEEADDFLQAATRDPHSAVENLVDRLLASPHYGERWARPWLDLARYADTNGYEKDRQRSIWPWRDWVINALNAGLPFDRFTIEQLAGDLLPEATLEQRIATGFHRNTMLNEEGGIDPLEFRFHAMTDRVATTGTTWLGLTVGCAQCHSHKFDPIQHREYYQFMAFFDNADEPDLDLPEPNISRQETAHEQKVAALIAKLADQWPPAAGHLEARFAEWLERQRARAVAWTPLRPVQATSNLPLLSVQPDASIFVSGDITKSDTYVLKFNAAPAGITAVRLEALPDKRLPRHGPGLAYYEGPKGDFFMTRFQLTADGAPLKFTAATESYGKNAMGGSPATAALAIDDDLQTGWSTSGREGEAHEAVFQLAAPLAAANELRLELVFGRHYACSLGRFRVSVTTREGGAAARLITAEAADWLARPGAELTAAQRERLRTEFLLAAPELASASAEIEKQRRSVPAVATTLVMQERPPENPRPTFLRHRGEFLQPAERIDPGVFPFLPPLRGGSSPQPAPRASLPPEGRPNRLDFARWLVAPENPLTARVTVNRAWAAFFGRGLVKTIEDFGFQGEPPSHPELLDWLAAEFMRHGWSLKRLHRLIATSATYRQSSRATPDLLARDPENRLLARGPRGRIEAEMVRDSALRAAGLLSTRIGGPSVRPPQPEGASGVSYSKPKWEPSHGEDRYRRGLYTFAQRTDPYAMTNTFDAPSGEACVARREVSNTPLQALTMLNDVVVMEAAQALGREFAGRGGSHSDRVRLMFLRCLTRPPVGDELAALTAFFEAQKQRLAKGELDPHKINGRKIGASDTAAWTLLARALLNLDEAVTKN